MFRLLLFFHVTCVALWLGSIGAAYILHRKAATVGGKDSYPLALQTTRSIVRGIMNPCALVVLVTGVVMLMQMGLVGETKPFWLNFMERFGGVVVLLSVGWLTWQMRRLSSAPAEQNGTRFVGINRALTSVGAGIIVTLFVVLLRL